jgi:hypothetical protein
MGLLLALQMALFLQVAASAALSGGQQQLAHVTGVYIALNLHNSEDVVPTIVSSLRGLLSALPGGKQAAFVSVYENGSGAPRGAATGLGGAGVAARSSSAARAAVPRRVSQHRRRCRCAPSPVDRTKAMLAALDMELTAMGVSHSIVLDDAVKPPGLRW